MKVLVVYHYFASYRKPILDALKNQSNSDIEYYFMSGTDAEINIKLISEEEIDEKRYLKAKNYWFSKKILWQRNVLKYSFKKDFDCIIYLGSPYFITTWLGAIFSRLMGKKVYFWTHGFIRGNSIADKVRKLFFKLPHGLLLYGEKAKRVLIKEGFKKESLHVIYNSLDYKKQIGCREKLINNNGLDFKRGLFKNFNIPIMLFIGRLTPQKKLDKIIETAFFLHQKGIKVNVLFVGSGEEEERLKMLVCSFNLEEYVNFYGAVYTEEKLAPLIFNSDLCISPGEVGLTAMHSMVYGTPVISHDSYVNQMPEYEAIVPNVTGDLYKYGDKNSLFETVFEWLNNGFDREIVRESCYKVIKEKYNPSVQVLFFNKALLGNNYCEVENKTETI